jgi:hypothetical protein
VSANAPRVRRGVVCGAGGLRPAITLGAVETSARTAAIALVGTAFCLVDADFAPVEVGDLVTSSETLGHAMKATEPMKVLLRHHRKGAGSPARRTLRSSDSDRAAIGYTTDAYFEPAASLTRAALTPWRRSRVCCVQFRPGKLSHALRSGSCPAGNW